MHMVIRVLVPAEDEEEGIEKARDILDKLCGDGRYFDFYTLFMENDTSVLSGKGRCGNLPTIARVESPEGKRLIEEGMKYTKDEFMNNVRQIRVGLKNFSDDELFNEELSPEAKAAMEFDRATGQLDDRLQYEPGMIKRFMYRCGRPEGRSTWLYDHYGQPIRNRRFLNAILSAYRNDSLWVAPADVHF